MAEAESKEQNVGSNSEEKKDQKAEEQKEEKHESPPPPLILEVELHCSGCVRKIRKSVLKIRGVEEVEMDMARNQVKVKGVVSPQAICDIIAKKTKRRTKVISPLPTSEGDPLPEVVISQVGGLTSVELNTLLHCEACAHQLNRRILKMRGVQTAAADFGSGKVMVTGTMDPNKLIEYVYKHTKKQSRIITKPEPEPQQQEEKGTAAESDKAAAEPEEGKEKPQEEAKKEESGGDGDGEQGGKEGDAAKEEEEEEEEEKEELTKKESGDDNHEDEKKMMMVMKGPMMPMPPMQPMMPMPPVPPYYYYQQPIYVIERITHPYPPPQLFSDENPNACCIS